MLLLKDASNLASLRKWYLVFHVMKWAWVNDGRSDIAPWQKQGQVKAHLRMKRVPKARKDKKYHIR